MKGFDGANPNTFNFNANAESDPIVALHIVYLGHKIFITVDNPIKG
jgi:hypothetical protein